MRRRNKILLGTLVIAGGGATAMAMASGGGDDDGARTVQVQRGDILDKALAVGRIEPLVEVSVKSQLAGVVRRRFAEPGDFVSAGSPLMEIRPNPTPLELVDGRRNVDLRELELEQLARNKSRFEALRTQDYVSQEEFESVERDFNQARLQLQIAKERLALLEEGRVTMGAGDVETVIKSPITGFILEKMVEIGDPVVPLTSFQEGTVLMTMARMDELIFRGTVDEIDVGRLEEGMPTAIKIGALPDARIEGVLTKISLKGREQESATIFPLEIKLTEVAGTRLRAGYSANADVIIEKREDVLFIPERLVTFEDDAARVTVYLSAKETEEREIETGLSDGINIEVLSGLEEGEKLVEPPPREIS